MGELLDDSLAALLSGPRARGAFLLRSVLEPPWSLRIADRAPLTVISMTAGQAYLGAADGSVHRLGPGQVGLVRGPEPYVVADDPATPAQVVIHPGQRCETLVAENGVRGGLDVATRSWGGSGGSVVMLTGTYQFQTEVGRRLLTALPAVLVQPVPAAHAGLLDLLAAEMQRDQPGQELVLDRVLDLLLVTLLREWLAGPGHGGPGWHRARTDAVVGPALQALHAAPERDWTVDELAAGCGVSRPALTRRFTALVGEPPFRYLTGLRMALAADLLADTDLTVAAVARRVGYADAFAFSAAFKREQGVSPQDYRTAHPSVPAEVG